MRLLFFALTLFRAKWADFTVVSNYSIVTLNNIRTREMHDRGGAFTGMVRILGVCTATPGRVLSPELSWSFIFVGYCMYTGKITVLGFGSQSHPLHA